MPLYKRPDQPEAELTPEEIDENIPAVPDTQLTPEEKTWKKRYGDLRSHTQKQVNELNAKLNTLTAQLSTTAAQQLSLPTSEEDVAAWAQKYPQVAAIVETIALQKAQKINEGVNRRLELIDSREHENDKERALLAIKKVHSDFDDLSDTSSGFHEWLADKSKRMQDSIYENDTDAQAAIETITMFKLETGYGKPKSNARQSNKDSARDIPTRNNTRPSNGVEPMFKESDIERMSGVEYSRNAEAIDKAEREGRIDYDVTNAKRDAARG